MNQRGQYGRVHVGAEGGLLASARDAISSILLAPSEAIAKARNSARAHLEGYRHGSRVQQRGTHRYYGEAYLKGHDIPERKESDDWDDMQSWILFNRSDAIWAGFFDITTGQLQHEAFNGKVIRSAPRPKPEELPPPTLVSPPSAASEQLVSTAAPEEEKSSMMPYLVIGALALTGIGIALVSRSRTPTETVYNQP